MGNFPSAREKYFFRVLRLTFRSFYDVAKVQYFDCGLRILFRVFPEKVDIEIVMLVKVKIVKIVFELLKSNK